MKKDKDSSYIGASFVSIFLHLVLLGGLLLGVDLVQEKQPSLVSGALGKSIEAIMIDPAIVNAKANQIRQEKEAKKREEAERIARLEQQAALLKEQNAKEAERIRKLREEKQAAEKAAKAAELKRQQLAEQKRQAQIAAEKAQEQKRIADAKREAAEEKRRKAQAELKAAEAEKSRQLAEKKRAEEAAKKAEEERQRLIERKRKAEEEAKKAEAIRQEAKQKAEEAKRQKAEQEALLGELFSGLESESEVRTSARGQQIADEVSQWASRYVNLIQQNWIVDASHGNVTCLLNLQLTSDGLVFNVEKVSGNELLCRSAKASIFKISQFPVPSDPLVMEKLKNINLKFEP